jgi:O-antigen ligase
VLPVLDLVRRPDQAKKILVLLAVIGLPSFLLVTLYRFAAKQGLEFTGLVFLQPAVAYWGPVGNSLWGVALLYRSWLPRLLAWGWILFYGVFLMFAGFRGNLYLIPIFLVVIVGALMADFYGAITLPIPDITRERYSTLFSPDRLATDLSMEGRILEGEALFDSFCQNPIVGVGLGRHLSFMWTDGKLKKEPYYQYHNGYLETLMKFGLVGTAVFFWFLGAVFLMSLRTVNSRCDLVARALGLGIVIWLVYSGVDSLAFSTFSDRGFALTVGVVAGILPALAKRHPLGPKPQGLSAARPRGRSLPR